MKRYLFLIVILTGISICIINKSNTEHKPVYKKLPLQERIGERFKHEVDFTQYLAADLDPRAGVNYYMAGSQDKGTISLSNNGLGVGGEVKGGDGMFCHIDQTNHNIQIATKFNLFMHATTNIWQTSTQVGSANGGRFVNPMDYDDINKKVYAANGQGSFFRWNDLSTGGSYRLYNK